MAGAHVHIRDNKTGEVRIAHDEHWRSDFQWAHGNYSCDCNRFLFFERLDGNEPESDDYDYCTDGRYDVVRVVFPDGSDHGDVSIFNHKPNWQEPNQ